jgi:Leucine-rich repeat (LRR) protein
MTNISHLPLIIPFIFIFVNKTLRDIVTMVTIVASALVETLCDKLGSPLLNEFSLLWGLETDLKVFKSTISTVKDVLEYAEKRCIKDDQVYNWLRKLKDNVYDADDLLDKLHLEAQRQEDDSRGQTSRVITNYLKKINPFNKSKLAHKIRSINKNLDDITAEKAKFHLESKTIMYSEINTNYTETWSKIDDGAVCGRDREKEKIISQLKRTDGHENISVISIVGLGGLGKTTLAQLVYNNVELDQHFDLKMWVYVSEVFVFQRIVKQMIESGSKNKCDSDNFDSLGEILSSKLKGKKFLLVLDDVWRKNCEENWDKLKAILKYGASGSKIIVTSRDMKVSEIMDVAFPFKLEGLSDDFSWDLFKQRAKISENEVHSQILKIAKEIMKRCAGVPLALKALGSIMRSKNSIEEWCSVRDSDIWELSNDEDQVIKSLKLSYMHLPSSLKECFTYCSIFPKGQRINKLELIGQWIAHGFISLHDSKGGVEAKGKEHFKHLVQMSFLQNVVESRNGDVTCKMHDLVHDVARSIVAHEFSIMNDMDSMSDIGRPENMNIKCRYLSLIEYSGKIGPIIIKKLRALHIEGSNFANDDPDIISKAKSLRSLAINGIYLESFTFSSRKLIHLRYVCFSDCRFTEIPIDFCALWSLQSLHLKGCHNLRKLPKSIGRVIGLRTLELNDCPNIDSLPTSIGQCKSLQNLIIRLRQIKSIPNSIGQLENIRLLNFSGCRELKKLPDDAVGSFKSIKCINLSDCSGLEEIPISIGNLKILDSLDLSYCGSLRSLPDSVGNLQNLQVLNLVMCTSIVALPSSISNLVNLETLNVQFCVNLGELPGGLGELVRLQSLDLSWCKSLRSLPDSVGNLQNLQVLNLNFTSIVALPSIISKLVNLENLNFDLFKQSGMLIGIGKLTKLRRLSNFVVGKGSKYAHISELEHLDCLSGRLLVSDLHNVSNPREAVLPNLLKQKKDLENITLHWGWDMAKREWDVAVLEALQPPPTIKQLMLIRYPRVEYSKWMMLEEMSMSSFPYLNSLYLNGLKNCTHLPCLVELPCLKYLSLYKMNSLRSFTGYFPVLVKLIIENMPNLEELTTMKLVRCEEQETNDTYESAFPHLQTLTLSNCPKIRIQPHRLPSVVKLNIGNNVLLDGLYFSDGGASSQTILPSLKKLKIRCFTLTSLPQSMQHLTALQSLEIFYCTRLRALPEWLGELKSLKYLYIKSTPLTCLPQSIQHLTALQNLIIVDCFGLRERCKRENGEDWPLISHIPTVDLYHI